VIKAAGKLVALFAGAVTIGAGVGVGQQLTGGVNANIPAYAQQVSTALRQPIPGIAPATMGRSTEEASVIQVAKQVSPAVVTISDNRGMGSGVIFDAERGLILTNAHVVRDAARSGGKLEVRFKNAKVVEGQVVGADTQSDIAVVRVRPDNLPEAQLGNSANVEVGQTAIAIGNPLGLEQTVTTGVVSAVNRKRDPRERDGFIQTDAAINPGNSGGPLCDSQGRVIGINTLVLRGGGGTAAEGLGFAVPINVARDIANQLVATGNVRRATLGATIGTVDAETAQQFRLPVQRGVIISEVLPGSAAERASLRSQDILTEADGQRLDDVEDLLSIIRSKNPGDTMVLRGVRPSGRFSATVRLGDGS